MFSKNATQKRASAPVPVGIIHEIYEWVTRASAPGLVLLFPRFPRPTKTPALLQALGLFYPGQALT